MKPKSYKEFKSGIADEVGVHENVVDDFIAFYYGRVRKNLSDLSYPRIFVDGLGTFVLRKQKLEKVIKRNKDILGNIGKHTYKGYEKSVAVKGKLENLQRAQNAYEEMVENKKNFKEKNK